MTRELGKVKSFSTDTTLKVKSTLPRHRQQVHLILEATLVPHGVEVDEAVEAAVAVVVVAAVAAKLDNCFYCRHQLPTTSCPKRSRTDDGRSKIVSA